MDANIEELKLQVANLMARVSMAEAQIAEMDDDIPESSQNVFSGDESLPQAYSSYFKLIDASTVEDGCQIGVTDGGSTGTPTNCGVIVVTGKRIDVPVYTAAVESSGDWNVWAHAWLDAVTGNHAEIRVTDGATMNPPDNPNSSIAYQSRLLGRFTSVSDGDGGFVITSRNQDYLAGGELVIDNWGACTE